MVKAYADAASLRNAISDLENPLNDTLAGVRLLEVVLEDLLLPEYFATRTFYGLPSFKFDPEDLAAVMHALRCTRRSIEEARDIRDGLFSIAQPAADRKNE